MSFLLSCPTCGERSVYEFRFGGEVRQRPPEAAFLHEWADYLYARKNEAGVQKEWWYHHLGCRTWFFAVRDTTTNTVLETFGADRAE
jgi:heterotetrameric sarcosine oxidase delta subunit